MKFDVTEWDTLKLVHGMDYEGDTLSVEDTEFPGTAYDFVI